MLASTCSIRPMTLATVKFLSRLFTALNLLPSIATTARVNRPSSRHNTTNRAHTARDRRAVVLAKIGDRLEIGRQPPGQPHQLDIALRFPFEPPARLHAVEIAVEVNLQ